MKHRAPDRISIADSVRNNACDQLPVARICGCAQVARTIERCTNNTLTVRIQDFENRIYNSVIDREKSEATASSEV